MIGTILNVAGILAGGAVGMARPKVLPLATESYLKITLAAFASFYGLRLTWLSLNGSAFRILSQSLILLLALMLGRLAGRFLQLQKLSNRLGRGAHERMIGGRPGREGRTSAAFKTAAVLFCLAPLGIIGAVCEGLSLSQYYYPLAVKAAIDGLATIGLVLMLGWGVILSVVPVLAIQGTITLISAHLLQPFLAAQGLVDSVNGVAGVLILAVALVMLGLRRVELADYLPSLAIAPVLTWALR